MDLKILALLPSLLYPLASLAAEEAWSYSDCVEYAREHNISLRQSRLSEQTYRYTLEAAEAQWTPSLSFATTHGFTNSPFINSGDKNIYDSSYGLNAAWTLWNGGERENTIKRDRVATRISELSTDDVMRSIETDILQLYIDILYTREAITINEEAARVSEAQADRARQLMEAGRLSRVDYTQLEAQAQQDRYAVVNAQGTYDQRRMQLKKLLELGLTQQLTVAPVEFDEQSVLAPLPPIEESYSLALATDARLEADRLGIESAELGVKIARAGYYPSIAVNAGIGTGYATGDDKWGEQMKRRVSESIGLTLSLPILDNKRTKTAVAKANVERLNAQLQTELRENEIAQTIEGLYISHSAAQARYISGTEQLKSATLSAELVGEQFNLGLVNTVELLTAHNARLQAQRELLQAKYMAMLDCKMLEFYRTAKVTL